ncbi:autotransporter domain-containing protein [Oceanicoccus sp. KOV_DT_Chl]|uniref:autotransporter domain-containing protein n=1 Tax=Oceanicoccus sp. KOV_DT_Chl TaxID=1904639 RepID=UPI000C7BD4E4|nr:autotransporter domain-containing protein [Oceanicoccus sp. KOV_DT_Chl]
MLKKMVVLTAGLSASILIAAPVQADTAFNELVVFGDSLMDTGNFGGGTRFTSELSPGVYAPIAPDFLASDLGLTLSPAIDGGTNYAVGGYRVADVLNSISGTGVSTSAGSANAYLTNVNGRISADTLILMDGGGNDIRDIVIANSSTPENIPAAVRSTAETYIAAIKALSDAGAQYIMVANAPDVGITPAAQYFETIVPGAADGLSQTSAGYNGGVETFSALSLAGVNLIPVDIEGFVNYVFANADTYGFAVGDLVVGSNTVNQFSMCYNDGPTNTDCIEHPTYGIGGTDPDPRAVFFNDGLHPAEATSELFGDYLNDIIVAPQKVGLLPELALAAGRVQAAAVTNELRQSRWAIGEGQLFISGDMSTSEYEDTTSSEAENRSLTVGRTFKASDTLIYGAAISLGQQELDVDAVDYEADSWGVSGLLGYRKDNVFIDANIGLTVLSYDDLERDFRFGDQTIIAEGDTDGHVWNIDLLAAYKALSADNWHIAPAIGMQYLNSTVDSFTESGGAISNYAWGEQNRKSLELSVGVVSGLQIGNGIRLFAEVFAVQEQEDENETLNIRNTNLGFSTYKLPSFQAQDDSFMKATLGGSLHILENANLNLTVNYSDRGDGFEHVALSYSMPM